MSWRRTQAEAKALVAETDAFLHGRYAELVESTDEQVPVWAWMNLLAHGSLDALRNEERQLRQTKGWQLSRAFLAGEIVDRIDSGSVTLDELQRTVLVPLELDIIDCHAPTAGPQPNSSGVCSACSPTGRHASPLTGAGQRGRRWAPPERPAAP